MLDVQAARASGRPTAIAELLADAGMVHEIPSARVVRTGFDPLDTVLGGGLRRKDLTLIGGRPGVGKTVATLQWARHVASSGQHAIYACYEHSELALLGRLLTMELGELARIDDDVRLNQLRKGVRAFANGDETLAGLLGRDPMAIEAFHRLTKYAERLWLIQASSAHTGIGDLEAMVDERDGAAVLFVDYLQKIAVYPEAASEADKVIRIAEGLKELALTHDVAVVAVAAADQSGLTARRMRLHHLRGSVSLAYEADIALMMNEKATAVSKIHLAYDPMSSDKFRRQVVFSIEKNRGGPANTDLEFEKDFANFRFAPNGGFVSEKLIDDIIYEE